MVDEPVPGCHCDTVEGNRPAEESLSATGGLACRSWGVRVDAAATGAEVNEDCCGTSETALVVDANDSVSAAGVA